MKTLTATIAFLLLLATRVLALSAPDQLVATAISGTQIKLVWHDRSTSETGFAIYRSSDGGATFSRIADVAANVTTFTDSGLQPGVSYTYHVASFANSVNSNGASATTAVQPTPSGPVPVGITGNFTLVYNDEFDGPGLNPIWNDNWLGSSGACTKPVNSAELSAYCPSQVIVSGGSLVLSAVRESVTASDGKTYQYKSGLVESSGRKEFTPPVIVEFRIQGDGSGQILSNWMAGWLNGHHGTWPDRGENDVIENLSGGPAWHYHAPGVNSGATISGSWAGWHTYATEWTASRIDYYYDGRLIGSQTSGVLSYPNYLILNYAISTQHGGALVVPAKMLVDYVRVWRRS